jgi:hypothetical protein
MTLDRSSERKGPPETLTQGGGVTRKIAETLPPCRVHHQCTALLYWPLNTPCSFRLNATTHTPECEIVRDLKENGSTQTSGT